VPSYKTRNTVTSAPKRTLDHITELCACLLQGYSKSTQRHLTTQHSGREFVTVAKLSFAPQVSTRMHQRQSDTMTTSQLLRKMALAAAGVLVISVPASAFSVPANNLALRHAPNRVDFCSTPAFRAPREVFSGLRCEPITAERTEVESEVHVEADAKDVSSKPASTSTTPERWLKKDQCGETIQRRALGLQQESTLMYLNQIRQQADMDTLESRVRRPDDFGDELGENSDDKPALKPEVARLRKRERLANLWNAFQESVPMKSMGRMTHKIGNRFKKN